MVNKVTVTGKLRVPTFPAASAAEHVTVVTQLRQFSYCAQGFTAAPAIWNTLAWTTVLLDKLTTLLAIM